MKALDFPFRILGGKFETTATYSRVVRAQIIDSLMTNNRERVMRPDYGADFQAFVLHENDELHNVDTARIIKERLALMVPRATIESVSIMQDPSSSNTMIISVTYRPTNYDDPETIQFNIPKDS